MNLPRFRSIAHYEVALRPETVPSDVSERLRPGATIAIVIDLKLGGEKATTSGLGRVGASIDALGVKLDAMSEKLRGVFSAGRSGGAASSVNATTRAVSQGIGPMERYIRALRQLGIAEHGGNAVKIADAQFAVARTSKALANAQTAADPQKDLLATSRVAIGPNGQMQIMPLVNRLMRAGMSGDLGGILNLSGGLGGAAKSARLTAEAEKLNLTSKGGFAFDIGSGAQGAATGLTTLATVATPAAIGIGAIAAAAVATVAALKIAEATLLDRVGAGFVGGGSGSQTARLANIGGALGMSATDMAHLARSVQEQVSHGGPLMGFAAGQGANVRGGMFGNLNAADTLLRLLPALSNPDITGNDQAMRLARKAGLEDQVGLLRAASPGMRNRALASAGVEMSPANLRNAADAQIAMNLAMTDFKNEVTVLAAQGLPLLTTGMKALSVAIVAVDTVLSPVINMAAAMASVMFPFSGGASASSGGSPIDANTRAVQMNTRAIEVQTRTVIGGGKRARNAIPNAWQGMYLDRQMDALSRNLGAFTL